MSYNPTIDFLALSRLVSGGARTERMPGLDFTIAALARAGLFTLVVSQTAPTVNQATTVWLRTSVPSWVAEGIVFLWDTNAGTYQIATPALWNVILAGASGYSFQSVTLGADLVAPNTSLLAVQRNAPVTTFLTLPSVSKRGGRPLQIVDWSINVTGHTITYTPAGAETVMQRNSWQGFSSADQLTGVTLFPSIDLNGWAIAP